MTRRLWLVCLAATMNVATSQLFAAPCVSSTLADYVSLGSGGCSVGALTFSDFAVEPFPGPGAVQIAPNNVALAPISGGFSLTSGTALSAASGELLGLHFDFHVSATGLSGGTIALGDTSVTPDGAITSILSAGAAGDAIAFDIGLDAEPVASFTSASASFFDVFVELGIDGGPSGSAVAGPNLGSVTFATQSVTVPEPSTFSLLFVPLGFALLRMLVQARRRHT
jgi:hypothetical protein